MVNVDIEDAYQEACTALGEALVTQRLLGKEIRRQQTRIEQLEAASDVQREGEALAEHARLMAANGGHDSDCAWLKREQAQKKTDMHLAPAECDCPLAAEHAREMANGRPT